MIGVVSGAALATRLPWLLPVTVLLALAVLATLHRRTALVLPGALLGCALVSWEGRDMLAHRLQDECTGRLFQLQGTVVSLPRVSLLDGERRRQRFEFEIHSLAPAACAGPRRVLLSWYGDAEIVPGQHWRFQARLRRPWGLANPGSFNIQSWYALTGIDATGSVRASGAELLGQADGQWLNQLRHTVSRAIARSGLATQSGAVLRAVTVADKSGINHGLWDLFQRLGINHLLVISGVHVAMVAALGLLLGRFLAGCLRVAGVAESFPAAIVAAALALFYTGMAGFSVATQRALFMLLCFVLASHLGRSSRGGDKLLIAALLVVLVDPLAPLGSGFWLSFAAVAALLWLAHWYRASSRLRGMLAAHAYMALFMLPLAGFWFGAGSWLAVAANLLMVPLVGLYVVPLALLGTVLFAIGIPGHAQLWHLAAWPLELFFRGAASMYSDLGLVGLQVSAAGGMLAVLSLGLLVVPGSGWRRLLAAILWLPLLLPLRAAPGLPRLDILDVGQGTAVVFRAAGRVLLYDTGGGNPAGPNLAQSVLIPYLRSQGVERIDDLVISHGDLDHSAGLAALLVALPVESLWLGGGVQAVPGARRCAAGQAWRWGELASFQFLSPAPVDGQSDNNASCVLAIEAGGRRLLLAGDIEAAQERQLVAYWQGGLASDLLLLAHHGSGTSSSQLWLNRVAPQVAVANHGYGNHFGHPAAEVVARLERQGVEVYHTAQMGALEVAMNDAGGWSITGRREGIKPWWM